MGTENFGIKNSKLKRIVGQNNFFVQKKFWSKKIFVKKKYFWLKKIFGQKKFLTKKIFFEQNFFSTKNPPKKVFDQKNFFSPNFFFLHKTFLSPKKKQKKHHLCRNIDLTETSTTPTSDIP